MYKYIYTTEKYIYKYVERATVTIYIYTRFIGRASRGLDPFHSSGGLWGRSGGHDTGLGCHKSRPKSVCIGITHIVKCMFVFARLHFVCMRAFMHVCIFVYMYGCMNVV